MTIIAGIDEAGYGPRLGPLFTSCAAFRVARDGPANPGGLWAELSACVARPGENGGDGRFTVGDSKALYSSGRGLARLEHALLAFLAAGDGAHPEAAEDLSRRLLSARCRASLAEHPWYADRGERLPADCDGKELAASAERLAAECALRRALPVHFAARALAEGEFNRRVARLGNKATALLELVAELLAGLRAAAGGERLEVCVDRLGGRTDYAPLLARAFPGAFAWEESRSAEVQRYRLEGLAGPTFVTFQVRAEQESFPVALASMTSKYLRELYMRRFNAWWQRLVPELPQTSGYHADANEFLAALAPHRQRLGVSEASLVRCR